MVVWMKQFKDDIQNITDDILQEEPNINLDHLINLILIILEESLLYSKQDKHYWTFIPIIKQIISEYKPELYGYYYNNFNLPDNSSRVEYLKSLPQYEQRTPEWFKQKKETIGASESAPLFGLGYNRSERAEKIIKKKSGFEEQVNNSSFSMLSCEHGTKFEPVVQMLYELKENCTLLEFGSIVHEKDKMISASPDGITTNGIMIEIKVPKSRQITGFPPLYYWVQMQQQMEVCDLPIVHFIECDIKEYSSATEYFKDYKDDKNNHFSSNGMEKGVLISYLYGIDNELRYIYPEKLLKSDEIDEFIINTTKNLNKDENVSCIVTRYWKLITFSKTCVWRDRKWWETNKHKFYECWDKIVYYRKAGLEEYIKNETKQKNNVKENTFKENIIKKEVCLIISDDEDNDLSKNNNKLINKNNSECLIISDDDD